MLPPLHDEEPVRSREPCLLLSGAELRQGAAQVDVEAGLCLQQSPLLGRDF